MHNDRKGEVMFVLYLVIALLTLYLGYIIFLFILSLFIPRKIYEKESPFFRFILNSSTRRVLFILRVHTHIVGMEKIPLDTKCLFVSNHISNYDPIVTWDKLRSYHIAFISKNANFSVPIFGPFIRKCCFLPIDRKSIREAVPIIKKAGELLERKEVSIGVYPEGKRSKTLSLLEFHDCVFRISQMGKAPLVVLTVSGTEKIWKNIRRLRRSDVYIDVVDVIPYERLKDMRSSEIGEEVKKLMETSLAKRGEK